MIKYSQFLNIFLKYECVDWSDRSADTFLLFSMLFIINYSLFKQEEKKMKTLKIFQSRLHIVNYN